MALFSQDALNPGVKKREVFGWAMYDFANSGYTTVVITAVFAAYFVGGIAQKAEWATFVWTLALSISYAIVMLTMPSLGAYADLRASKKKLLMLFTAGCVVSTAALAFAGPGSVALAFVLIIVSNTFYSYGESLTSSFLPELARPEALGKVSGWGWSFGYFGGMLALGICLGYALWAGKQGISADRFVPVTMLITAAIYGAAALVTFKLLKERAVPKLQAEGDGDGEGGFKASLVQLKHTFDQARRYQDFMWLLLCAVFYQGGVAVAITLAAIYAEQVIGFVQTETMVLIFWLWAFSGPPGSQAGAGPHAGRLDRHVHHRRTHHHQGRLLVRRRHCRRVHGQQPVGWARHGRHVCAAPTAGRVLRFVDLCHAPGQHHRAANLRCHHLGDRRQPAYRHCLNGSAVCDWPGGVAAGGCGARATGGAACSLNDLILIL
jgi:MFS-type transporter involved in bile tolerance (Atg22 family)